MKIAILDDYQHVALASADWTKLPAECEITVFDDTITDEDALVERLRPFQIICAMRERTPIMAPLIARLPELRLIVTTGMRNPSIDIAAANARGVLVCGTRSSGPATAELTMAMLLAVSRNLVQEVESVRSGGWQVGVARGLSGRTLGLVGLGKLGSRVAECAGVFGVDLIAWSQNLTEEKAAAAGARLVTKDELFARSDYVSIHVVLSERTRGLVGERELSLMKPGAALINTSRGPIVDTGALIAALQRGRPGVAALDVYDTEPLAPDSPLRTMPNVIPTPHIGYVTQEAYEIYFNETVEDIIAFLNDEPVRVLAD
jgi:phosphoglycerate dehydrogenase-like enzyme